MVASYTVVLKNTVVKTQTVDKVEACDRFPQVDPWSALPGYFSLTFTATSCKDDMEFSKYLAYSTWLSAQ